MNCVGNEHHYMYICPETKHHWTNLIPEIRKRTGIEIDLPCHMLAARNHVTLRSWRIIGMELSKAAEKILKCAEDPNVWR